MFIRKRLWFYFCILILLSCESVPVTTFSVYSGSTMGTTYSVKAHGAKLIQSDIENALFSVNQSLSTYIDTSLISAFNQCDSGMILENDDLSVMLVDNYRISREIHDLSGGAFDPTVMPLVNLWGFGYAEKQKNQLPDSLEVDSVRSLVGFNKISLVDHNGKNAISKSSPEVQLDFSAVAKGYGVDKLADLIEEKGGRAYMVEIGGEVRVKGQPSDGSRWNIGINKPEENAGNTEIQAIVELKDQAMATSGNYRNFYEVNGVKVSHSINPSTGYPERSTLLSATVVHAKCAYADAMATACMILGLDGAKELINMNEAYEAYFIYGLEDGTFGEWQSDGFPNIQFLE